MNFKKFVSSLSALTIAASAFAGMAVTVNAATTLYSQDFEELTTDTLTGVLEKDAGATYGSTVTVETDSTNYLKMYSGNGNRDTAATYQFDSEVTDSTVTLSFRTQLSAGNFYSTGAERTSRASIYVLPGGKAVTPSNNAAPTDYLFSLNAYAVSDANKALTSRSLILTTGSGDSTLFLSDSDDATTDVDGTAYGNITMTSSGTPTTSWITVKADINFGEGNAEISINGVILGTFDLASATTGISGIAYQGGGKSYGYAAIDDILVTAPEADDHNYTINAVDASGNVLSTVATGTAKEGSSYSVTGLAEVITVNGVAYQLDSSVADHTATFTMGTADATETVKYVNNENIKFFAEAESSNVDSSTDTSEATRAAASGAATGYISANTNLSLGTLPSGEYKITAALASRGDRGLYIRNTDIGDTTQNVIGTFDITRTSSAGVYTLDISLAEETNLGLTGFTTTNSTSKTNQSANFDYIIIEYVGAYVAPVTPAEIGEVVSVQDTFTKGDGIYAKSYKFTVTPGTNAVTKVAVTVNGTTQEKTGLNLSGEAVFGIIITAANEATVAGIATPTVTVE